MPTDNLGHVYSQVASELQSLGISEQELNQDGLRITTTLDPALEKQATPIAEKVMSDNPAKLRSALVAEDPNTGAIVAYYGGDNGAGLDYAQVLKQPGSSFKPFVMAAALEHLLVVRGAQVLDIAGTASGPVHDLHRGRPRAGPHHAHVRHQRRLRDPFSAQNQPIPQANPQGGCPEARGTSAAAR